LICYEGGVYLKLLDLSRIMLSHHFRKILLSIPLLFIGAISTSLSASAMETYESNPGLAQSVGIKYKSIVSEPRLKEEETYPTLNLQLQKTLSKDQYYKLFWSLAQFTKETGIKVELPDSSSGYSKPEGADNLSDTEIDKIILQMTRLKPYAIALNLNFTPTQVKTIKIYRQFRDAKTGGFNEGKSFSLQLNQLELDTTLHELLHSVDPFANTGNSKKCVKYILGNDAFNRLASDALANADVWDYFARDYLTDDDVYSGRAKYLSPNGIFSECVTVVGQESLRISSPKKKVIFYKFVALLGLNSPVYHMPNFVQIFTKLMAKGSNISAQDAERSSEEFRVFWRSMNRAEVSLGGSFPTDGRLADEQELLGRQGYKFGYDDGNAFMDMSGDDADWNRPDWKPIEQ
jgi:hypothetical protein